MVCPSPLQSTQAFSEANTVQQAAVFHERSREVTRPRLECLPSRIYLVFIF